MGAFATMVLQWLRDGQVNRRDVRAAARVIRAEIVRNMSTVETTLAVGMIPPSDEVKIRFNRIDTRIDQLAIDLPRQEIGLLVAFLQMTEQAATLVERVKGRNPPGLQGIEHAWLAETFMPAADFSQVFLDMRGMRVWEIARKPRTWWAFRKRRKEVLANGFATPQLDAFLAKQGAPPQ